MKYYEFITLALFQFILTSQKKENMENINNGYQQLFYVVVCDGKSNFSKHLDIVHLNYLQQNSKSLDTFLF